MLKSQDQLVEVAEGLVADLATSQPAQRWAREATFHLVFAQTSALRRAVLSTTGS